MSSELQTEADIRAVLATPQGRRVLWEILVWAGIFQTTADVSNPYATFFNEGRRALGLQVLTHLEAHAPGSLDQMRREANEIPRPVAVGNPEDAGSGTDDTGTSYARAEPDPDFDPFDAPGGPGGDR